MSATGRNKKGRERNPSDFYATPAWCVDRLLETEPWIRNAQSFLEPCAGDGAILRALGRPAFETVAWELQDRFRDRLALHVTSSNVVIGDALDLAARVVDFRTKLQDSSFLRGESPRFDLALTNPPYEIAFPLLLALWPLARTIVFLLRVSFLASEERQPFLSRCPPAIRVLPNRPSFKSYGSDNCEYAWMIWHPMSSGSTPSPRLADEALEWTCYQQTPAHRADVRVLGITPREVRAAQKNETARKEHKGMGAMK